MGPKTAAQLVDAFGAEVLDMLSAPDAIKRMTKALPRLGIPRAKQIKESWDAVAGGPHSARYCLCQ